MTVNLVCPKCGYSVGVLCGGATSRETLIDFLDGYMTCQCGAFMRKTGPLYGSGEPIKDLDSPTAPV